MSDTDKLLKTMMMMYVCTGGCGKVSESKADRGSLGCSKHGKTWKSFV